MSSQGKNLQDIYDNGSSSLDDLEIAGKTGISDVVDRAVEKRERRVEDSRQALRTEADESESELRSKADAILQEIAVAVEGEKKGNQELLDELKERMLLSKLNMTASIENLSQSFSEKLTGSAENLIELQERSAANRAAEFAALERDTSRKIDLLTQKEVCELGLTTTSELSNIFEISEKLPGNILGNCVSYAQNIEQKIQPAIASLWEKNEKASADLKGEGSRIEQVLSSLSEEIRQELQALEKQSKTDLFNGFEELLARNIEGQTAKVAQITSDLGENSRARSRSLFEKQGELSSMMESLLQKFISDMDKRNAQVSRSLEEESRVCADNLKARLDAERRYFERIERDRHELISGLIDDLKEIESGMKTRLSHMFQSSMDKLNKVSTEAENMIVSVHDACAEECKSLSSAQKSRIESKCTELLAEIQKAGGKSIKAIRQAAGGRAANGIEEESTALNNSESGD